MKNNQEAQGQALRRAIAERSEEKRRALALRLGLRVLTKCGRRTRYLRQRIRCVTPPG